MTEATESRPQPATLVERYRSVRAFTDRIIKPLSAEDCMVQSMDDVSPTRWHIAHTTWFFETFVLKAHGGYREYDPQFNFLFNSYYNAIGRQFPRPQRGFISRPGLDHIKAYRSHVDQCMAELLDSGSCAQTLIDTIEVGLHHEQQHQELMLTDIKHVLSCNPAAPAYDDLEFDASGSSGATTGDWLRCEGGLCRIGHPGNGFSFDNESPQHQVYLNEFRLARNLVTCGEFMDFMEDRGYEQPQWWLSMGWSSVCGQGWDAPMYWVKRDGQWCQFTLAGLHPAKP